MEAEQVAQRYKIVNDSQSAHCCFEYTVVDTTRPHMIGDHQYKDQFEAICETFEKEEAQLVCNALNLYNASLVPGCVLLLEQEKEDESNTNAHGKLAY